MKYEWRKQEKSIYGVKQTQIVIDIPPGRFILQLDALYAIAKYSLRIRAVCPTLSDRCVIDWHSG